MAPALEIIDSSYRDFKFSLTDVVADNSSSSSLVVGPWAEPSGEFGNLGMLLEFNSAARQIESTAAILGHPLLSLVAAARLLSERGESLAPVDVLMAGGATAAEVLIPGDYVQLSVERLGCVAFSVVK